MRKILDWMEKVDFFKTFVNLLWGTVSYMLPIFSYLIVKAEEINMADWLGIVMAIGAGIIFAIWSVYNYRQLRADPENRKKRWLYATFMYFAPAALSVLLVVLQEILFDMDAFSGWDGLIILVLWLFCGIEVALSIIGFVTFLIVCRVHDKRVREDRVMAPEKVRKIHDVLHCVMIAVVAIGLTALAFVVVDEINTEIQWSKIRKMNEANKAYREQRVELLEKMPRQNDGYNDFVNEAWLVCVTFRNEAMGNDLKLEDPIWEIYDDSCITSVEQGVFESGLKEYAANTDKYYFSEYGDVLNDQYKLAGDSEKHELSIGFDTSVMNVEVGYGSMGSVVAVYDEDWNLVRIYMQEVPLREERYTLG